MPTYDYRCNGCDHRWELFQSITADPEKKCPRCGKRRAERMISAGGAVIFKGSGFYQTDYRSDSYKKSAESESKPAAETKTDAKPDKPAASAPAASESKK